MFDKGFFGGLFDFNGDGKLDGFERAAEYKPQPHPWMSNTCLLRL